VVVIALALILLLVFPTRAWLAQRDAIRENEQRLELLEQETARLEEQRARLQTPEEIERIARSQYNLVKPGEQPFAVLPSPAPPPLPDVWPYGLLTEVVAARGVVPPEPVTTGG
jgi:cell division protein FtsB